MKRLLGLLVLLPLAVWAQGPFDGTWKVNVKNAQFSQKPEVIVLKDGRYSCSTCNPKIDIKADGSDQKVAGAKGFDTLAVKEVDPKTVRYTRRKGGQVIGEASDSVSADGKSITTEFKDYPPQGAPVTGKFTQVRATAGPAGSHAISGGWRMDKVENISDNGLTFSYKGTADGMTMTSLTGESYDAKFDGKDYPLKSDRAGGTISLKKLSGTSFEETYKQDAKPIAISVITVDGKTMKVVSKDVRRGTTDTFTAEKQ